MGADSAYVNITGDTMTGDLNITPADFTSTTTKHALKVVQSHSSGGGVSSCAAVISNASGTHDYGRVLDINIASTTGDKPSIRFSAGACDGSTIASGVTSWSIGHCGSSSDD